MPSMYLMGSTHRLQGCLRRRCSSSDQHSHTSERFGFCFISTMTSVRGTTYMRTRLIRTAVIDQIMIDPRMAERDVNALRSKIRSETSFKGPIKRSLLYAAPPDMILPFG